jgi:hypothetical protein
MNDQNLKICLPRQGAGFLRGLKSTAPATKSGRKAYEVQRLPGKIITTES